MIAVTGATGMVGGHLLWHLLLQNNNVVAFKRRNSNLAALEKIFSFYTKNPAEKMQLIQWRNVDITDTSSIEAGLEGIKSIYHCAAVVSLSSNSEDIIQTNVEGTRNIAEAAIKLEIERFCFVSSIAACGNAAFGELIDENTPLSSLETRSTYSRSKYLSEQVIKGAISKGLNAVIVNPGVILGFSGTSSGSSELFARVRKGLPFYTTGGSGYIDVRDVVKIMIALTNQHISGENYILIAENCSNQQILNAIADGYQKKRPFIKIGYRLMYILGLTNEWLGKITGKQPTISRSLAKSATSRSWYSNKKITDLLQYKFCPIYDCIQDICKYELLQLKSGKPDN